jgi:hypothetical protein
LQRHLSDVFLFFSVIFLKLSAPAGVAFFSLRCH